MKNRLLILYAIIISLLVPAQAYACAAQPWAGFPKTIKAVNDGNDDMCYYLTPNIALFSPMQTISERKDIFPPRLPLTKELTAAAKAFEDEHGNGLRMTQEIFKCLAHRMGKENVDLCTENGVVIYLLPDLTFSNAYAAKRNVTKINGYYFKFGREIWIDASNPGWPNVLIHELGHLYDYAHNSLSRKLYHDQYFETTTRRYFSSLDWIEDPSDWFAEAFVLCYGIPCLRNYPPLDEYEKQCPGVKAEILRGAEFLRDYKEGANIELNPTD